MSPFGSRVIARKLREDRRRVERRLVALYTEIGRMLDVPSEFKPAFSPAGCTATEPLAVRGGEMAHLRRSRSIGALLGQRRRSTKVPLRFAWRAPRRQGFAVAHRAAGAIPDRALARGESCLFCAVMVRSCPARILNAFATAPS